MQGEGADDLSNDEEIQAIEIEGSYSKYINSYPNPKIPPKEILAMLKRNMKKDTIT